MEMIGGFGDMTKENDMTNEIDIHDTVLAGYGAAARSGLSSNDEGVARIAQAFGYTAEELRSIPAEATLGLSCGNPVALASLRPGETVVDLGSGGGVDVFLAARKVGPEGRVIGVDMTGDMIALARRNAAEAGVANVEFRLAEIEAMPIPDGAADCVISNCVLNLTPDKQKTFAEIFRVLKPGGRLAVSDIALRKPLPEAVRADAAAWVSCVAGAISMEAFRSGLLAAGFQDVEVVDSGADLNVYKEGPRAGGCCAPTSSASASAPKSAAQSGPQAAGGCCCGSGGESASTTEAAYHAHMSELLAAFDFNEYAASVKVFAIKPL
jgi:arsenite methyltransferase